MNRRQDEELIRLAFGDLEGPEAEALRRHVEADPVAAPQFAQLCAIKDDLSQLRQVPEMQLGKERLRARLLDGGLAPKRFHPLRLAWLPASFALAMVAFLSFRPGLEGSQPLVESSGQTVALDFARFDHAELTRRVFHPVDDVALEMSDPVEQVASVRPTGDRPNRRRSPSAARPVSEKAKSRPFVAASSPAATAPAAESVMDSSTVLAAASAEAPAPSSVVLIGNERDRGTGAQIAREVNQNADVVFGG